ncbi:hypothetical protein [Nocardia sp. NPDC050406]|uniref:hypothetical protein n=1 Tax=Nocardia sp. NPDC050406 TaxID=3364318 RepID=UPI00378D04C3
MATTQLTETVLPFSVAATAPFHVSVLITHRLDGGGSLSDYPAMADWVSSLRSASFALRVDSRPDPIPCRALLNGLADTSTWQLAFPGETTVREFPKPTVAEKDWNTLPAARTPEHALDAHYASVFSSPLVAPGVTDNALARAVLDFAKGIPNPVFDEDGNRRPFDTLIGGFDRYRALRDRHRAAERAQVFTDAQASLEPATVAEPSTPEPGGPAVAFAAETGRPASPVETLARFRGVDAAMTSTLDEAVAASTLPEDPTALMLRDAHATAKYYNRPEAQQPAPHPEQPEDGKQEPRPPRQHPDFHQLAGSCGSTPALARRLGFIVDLVVEDLEALKAATKIWCDITVVGVRRLLSPQTRCHTSGDLFLATPETDRWVDGRLALGLPQRYRVMDLDPDAAGLKLEQHLRGAIRAYATELNGDATTFAPAALRATGFTIAEIDRRDAVRARVAQAQQREPVADTGAPGQNRLELGYESLVRGLRLEVWDDVTAVWHSVHERTVSAHVDGSEVLAATADPGYLQNAPLSRVPGNENNPYYLHEVIAGWDGWSLSAPRPGRIIDHNYETGHAEVVDGADADPGGLTVRTEAVPGSLPALRYGRRYSFRVVGVDLAGNSVPHGMNPAAAVEQPGLDAAEAHVRELRAEAAARDERGLLEQVRTQRAAGAAPGQVGGFAGRVLDSTAAVLRAADALKTRPQWEVDAATLAKLFADTGDPNTVSTPRPYLRWGPVTPPTVVPRRAYGIGESLLHLVLHTGVENPDTTIERHLLPPQTSQHEAEHAGMFDRLMRSGDPADRRRAYAIALKERGNLYHTSIQDLDDPNGSLPQPGVRLVSNPAGNPATAVTLEQLQETDGAASEEQQGEGQYVVHEVDDLMLPYLPDPMAAGVTLVFYQAGRDHHLANAKILQAVTIPYTGDWPLVHGLRLVLHDAPALQARQDGAVIRVGLPAGEQVAVAVSSSLVDARLDQLGLWRFFAVHDPKVSAEDRAVLRRAARDGWLWWLTPGHDLRLVNAVVRPVVPPSLTSLRAQPRVSGAVAAELVGVARVHGASTERVELHAEWSDPVDDPAASAPGRVTRREIVTRFAVTEDETDSLLTAHPDAGAFAAETVEVPQRPAVHVLPDTRYRRVSYRFRGTSRYREFFTPEQLPTPEDPASFGAVREVEHLNCAKPPIPGVRDVIPMFLWSEESEPEHPFAIRRTRRGGVRIWLERGWDASGDDELLAVFTADSLSAASDNPAKVSVWGRDPAFVGTTPELATDLAIAPYWEQRALQLDVTPPERAGQPRGHVAVSTVGRKSLRAYTYRPEFHAGRGLWFVDVVFDAADVAWPFLRLAVARYQPKSIPGHEFSPTITTDFVQLMPDRVSTVSRPEAGAVRVTTSGTYGFNRLAITAEGQLEQDPTAHRAWLAATRKVVATLQTKPSGNSGDLEWTAVGQVECAVEGVDAERFGATWSGLLPLDPALTLATPGTSTETRVLIEEYELLPADPPPGTQNAGTVSRLVYADHLRL